MNYSRISQHPAALAQIRMLAAVLLFVVSHIIFFSKVKNYSVSYPLSLRPLIKKSKITKRIVK
jgi:hypothetical protein